jgi:hypothetical protein
MEESAYWLELLVESGVVNAEKPRPCDKSAKSYRDFRHYPEASEDF